MKDVIGFLRWQFQGIFSSLTFWGAVIATVAVIAEASGCPMPWPARVGMIGIVMVIGDAIYSWFRFSYQLYQLEQNRIMRELERK